MRNFLYLTPYFPPVSRVGALRPLKFVRHLPSFGWNPIILSDLWSTAAVDRSLLSAIPDNITVLRDFSSRAGQAVKALDSPLHQQSQPRKSSAVNWEALLPRALTNPELIPLSDHGWHMSYATRAAHRALDMTSCEAIMVNADPYAAVLVGARVAHKRGLPLIIDLRDPWSVCELRRKMRPGPIRYLVDRWERRCVEQARFIILNTESSRQDYLEHYADLDKDRFITIRNHADPDLINQGQQPEFDRFTLLFLGNLRRFLEGETLLSVLGELSQRGVNENQFQLVVTGNLPPQTLSLARRTGVEKFIKHHPFVPYLETGPTMNAADLLLLLSHRTQQRIPAKFYEYATTRRPIIGVTENPELVSLLKRLEGTSIAGHEDISGIADHIQEAMAQGRQREVTRTQLMYSSLEATGRLAELLDHATTSTP